MSAAPPSLLWPADNPAVTAHLNTLQGIITRLANNSVSCKTWCLTLVGAMVSLAGAAHAPAILGFVFVPIILFGILDTMYIAQEAAYRALYGSVVESVRNATYSLATAYETKAPIGATDVLNAVGSWAIWPVYLGLIVAYVIAHSAGWTAMLAGH
jgi:hypothetical protein